ncbi:MAG: hypothetical protein CM1200mP16_02330 [Nitrospina sp.]|nr:MAG: hypothetical protein CM1200mP16_02330 [Nitrospina sp.]
MFTRKAMERIPVCDHFWSQRRFQFLKKKLELGEISQKECKEIMKRLILQKYDSIKKRSFRATILGFGALPRETKLTT